MNGKLNFKWYILAGLCIFSALTLLGLQQPCVGADGASKAVTLVVDYGDGVQKHFTSLPWKSGYTVLDVLEAAKRHPRGIRFTHRGKGSTAFLTQIDDLKNEGRGKNWIYQVNGEVADRSFAIFPVKPSAKVLWKFGKYE